MGTRMMKLVTLLAAIALCTALPTETETSEAFGAAQNTISELLQQGKDSNECRDLAEATIKEIKDSVASTQKDYNVMPKGEACEKAGQEGVTAAENEKIKADKRAKDAQNAKDKACNASVGGWTRRLDTLSEGNCDTFYSSSAYITAAATCAARKKTLEEAEGAVTVCGGNVVKAKEAAIKAKNACQCKTQASHKKAAAAIEKANSGDNEKAWTKAHHILCVLDDKAPINCLVPAVPKVKSGPLHKGVADAKCS